MMCGQACAEGPGGVESGTQLLREVGGRLCSKLGELRTPSAVPGMECLLRDSTTAAMPAKRGTLRHHPMLGTQLAVAQPTAGLRSIQELQIVSDPNPRLVCATNSPRSRRYPSDDVLARALARGSSSQSIKGVGGAASSSCIFPT